MFQLARDAGIPLDPGEEDVLEDQVLLQFCERWKSWAKKRDQAVQMHLGSSGSCFRSYLPYNSRTFRVAYETLWYFDELIVSDPLETVICSVNPDEDDYEQKKQTLRETIQLLHRFRQALESGYLLLVGRSFLVNLGEEGSVATAALLRDPSVVAHLDQTVRYGLRKGTTPDGRDYWVYEADVDSGGLIGMTLEKPQAGDSIPLPKVGKPLPRATLEEIRQEFGEEQLTKVRDLYPREVERTLRNIVTAHSFSAAALFDRPVDATILARAALPKGSACKTTRAIAQLNLVLPFLKDVPPDRLLELRDNMPDAFREFRATVAEIVERVCRENPDGAAEALPNIADRDVLGAIRRLELEMKAIGKKTRLLGCGLSTILTVGSLIGASLGVDAVAFLAGITGAATSVIGAGAHSVEGRTRAKGSPYYFLWRARQNP